MLISLTDTRARVHGLVWSKIVRCALPGTWILLGPRLKALYDGEDLSGEVIYLALVCLEWDGDLQYDLDTSDLRAILLPHSYNEATCEAKLNDSSIIINIWAWAKQDDATAVTSVYNALLFEDSDCMRSYLMYNYDEGDENATSWGVRTIEHRETSTALTEREHFCEGVSALAGRHKGSFRIHCTMVRVNGQPVSWMFFEWDGRPSIEGDGGFGWLHQAWDKYQQLISDPLP
ncbi:hypothetical protein BJF96_g9481 [Verticillium dahliae]|uniref:Uncharacterized protein n=1 Tax=Verticillium dahliae TaxID=27337 RepID=A0AA44W955_VERDA|nr:hypothetical protein BJF96_g9481 [Verticillium dahliae]